MAETDLDAAGQGGTPERAVEEAVERAIAGVADLAAVPVAEHVARFDAVHRALSEALAAIDGA